MMVLIPLIDNNDIALFKNILNDMYAKDLSRKVKSTKRQRALNGLFIAAQAPYGYIKDPLDNNHLIVDEEIRPIIKLIYRLALEGHGCPKIASILTEKGVFILQVIINELKAILGLLDLKIKVELM